MNKQKYFKLESRVTTRDYSVALYSGWFANVDEKARQETVATIASLSYGRDKAKDDEKLYNRLKALKHDSLFEFVNIPNNGKRRIENSLRLKPNLPYSDEVQIEQHKESVATFLIEVPIFIARQFMRHRCFSYLERSMRYVDVNKMDFKVWTPDGNSAAIIEQTRQIYNHYKNAGYKIEDARAVVPVGTYTKFYVQGDAECLRNFFALRLAKDAQPIIRELAGDMLAMIKGKQPVLYGRVL